MRRPIRPFPHDAAAAGRAMAGAAAAGSRGLLLACLAAIAGCGGQDGAGAPAGSHALPVTVMRVEAAATPNFLELPGRVEAVRSAQVRARADGIVEQQLFVDGTEVEAGAPLFRIDQRDLRARQQQARAALASANAARAQARTLVERMAALLPRNAVSVQEYDTARTNLQLAEAAVLEAQSAVERAQLQLDHAIVRAPIAGRVGRAQVSEGALVGAAAATLLAQVDQLDPVFVIFNPSGTTVADIRRRVAAGELAADREHMGTVALVLDDGTRYPLQGVVDFAENAVDPGTGSQVLRARFDNPDRILLPGQFVTGIVSAGLDRNGISLPERAVAIGAEGASVTTVSADDVAVRQPVVLAGQADGRWVVREGLKAGDLVIVDGWHKIQPGQAVRPVEAGADDGKAP